MGAKKMVQTTIRSEPEILYKARLALNLRGLSVAKFINQKLQEVVNEYEQSQQQKEKKKES